MDTGVVFAIVVILLALVSLIAVPCLVWHITNLNRKLDYFIDHAEKFRLENLELRLLCMHNGITDLPGRESHYDYDDDDDVTNYRATRKAWEA